MGQISRKLEEKLKAHPYILFVIKSFRRILTRDINYVNFALEEYSNPKRLSIKTYGNDNMGKLFIVSKNKGWDMDFLRSFYHFYII